MACEGEWEGGQEGVWRNKVDQQSLASCPAHSGLDHLDQEELLLGVHMHSLISTLGPLRQTTNIY